MSDSTPLTRGDLRRALDALRKPVSRYTCEWRNDTCGCIECRGDRAVATLDEPTPVPSVQRVDGGVTERPQPAPPCSEPDAKPAASAALPEIKAVGWYHPNPHGKDITRPAYGQSFSYGEEHPPNAQYEPLVPLATARAYADALTEAQRECGTKQEIIENQSRVLIERQERLVTANARIS